MTHCPYCRSEPLRTAHHATWFRCGSEAINGHFWPSPECLRGRVEEVKAQVDAIRIEARKIPCHGTT